MNKLICSMVSLLLVVPAFGQLRVSQTATASGAGYPMVTAFPSAPAAGDLLVALVGYYSSDSVTPPTGWTVLKQQYGNTAGGTTGFTSFYHLVTTGESNSYTFNQGYNAATLALYDIAGADVYHPFNNFTSDAQTTSAASVTNPTVTPTVAGTLPLAAIADEASQPTGTLNAGWTYTPSASTRHPVGAAYGPLSSNTSSAIAPQFSLSTPDGYGLAALTVLVNPAGTTGHTPTANPGGPYAGVTSFAVSLDGSASTDPRGEALAYAWDFGDGSKGTDVRPTHVYASPGTYTIALTVTDTDGNIAHTSTPATIGQDCSSVSLGNFGAMNGFVPSATDAWHQDVSGAAVDPMSNTILVTNTFDLAGSHLHPDFGGNGAYGIPYTVVDSSVTPSVPLNIQAYAGESDVTLYPIPKDMPVEGSPADCSGNGDNHAIVFDKHTCAVHEMYHTQSCSTSSVKWSADAGTIWDLTLNEKRPFGYTSVDAAGLSVFEGLIRYDEIVAGTINHAIRFTAQHTKNNTNNGYFTGMATHAAGDYGTGVDNIEGMRIRLKANFDTSSLSPQAKIIATAMKKYGMILADNGSNLFFQGTPDTRWNDDDLNTLKAIPASAFEVINQSLSANYAPGAAPLYPNGPIYDAVNHPTGAAPTISSFTASTASIASGQSVTLTPVVLGSSYSYIDKVGFIRGAVTVNPAATTTYMLTSTNSYGTSTSSVTVTVTASTAPALVLAPVTDKTYGSDSFLISATSDSPGAITYSVVSGPASLAGNRVTLTGIGGVTIQASQVTAGNYAAATALVSFTVNPAAPTLAFVPVQNQTYGVAPFPVSSTSNSSGGDSYSVVSGPASLSGNVVTLTGIGGVVLKVDQAAAGNYAAASATTSFTVTAEASRLAFTPIPTQTYGASPFVVNASSLSPGYITYSVVSGPAITLGDTVALTGVGVVTLQASQAATGDFAAATATTSFTVNAPLALPLTLRFLDTTPAYLSPIYFSASVASNGKVGPTGHIQILDGTRVVGIFTLRSYSNGTVEGRLSTTLSPGTHQMTAVYSGDNNYAASRSATVAITVQPVLDSLCTGCRIARLP